jgi:c-di-GMP-binding flagellar brake protein YcgR
MPFQHDQRKYPRLSITDRAYGVLFEAKGTQVKDSRLVNLSAGGCGLEVQITDARHLEIGDMLEGLYLDHSDLPLVPLTALILRMLGKVPGKTTGYAIVGVEFQDITPLVQGLIAGHVETQLAEGSHEA